jgi:hypothetical protein
MKVFENWCAMENVCSLPAAPVIVARFVREYDLMGIDAVWAAVCEISQAHVAAGLADPTLGGVVAGAVNDITKIDAPRSWPKAKKLRFYSLPYDLQKYIAENDRQRETNLRRIQNEAADARKALAAIQKPKVTYAKAPKAA